MRVFNNVIIPAGTDASAGFTSDQVSLYQMYGYAIQIAFTGSAVDGTFKLQASADPFMNTGLQQPQQDAVNWSDVENSSHSVTQAGNYMWNVYDVMYNYVRVVYTPTDPMTDDTVITSAILNGKGV